MSIIARYIDPNIANDLKENCKFVKAFCDTYYWKHYNHFNVFFNLYEKLEITNHNRGLDGKPIPIEESEELLEKYKNWSLLNYNEYLEMLREIELLDKKLSLTEKYKSIEQDF